MEFFDRLTLIVFAFCALFLFAAVANAETGEAARKKPFSVTLEGPASVPVTITLKANPAKKPAPATLWIDIFQDGKGLKRISAAPGKAGTTTLNVPAGKHVYEFKAEDPASLSAAISWTAPAKGGTAVAAATPAATPAAAAPAAPAASAGPVAARSGSRDRLAVEGAVLAFARFSEKRYDLATLGISITALKPINDAVSVGGAIGWRHLSGARTFDDYQGRVLPPYVLDIDVVPIEMVGRYTRPLSGKLSMRGQAGLGLEYAKSSYENASDVPRRTTENDWAPTYSLGLGADRRMAGGTLGATVGIRFARHAFAAHSFDLLHGAEIGLGYTRGF